MLYFCHKLHHTLGTSTSCGGDIIFVMMLYDVDWHPGDCCQHLLLMLAYVNDIKNYDSLKHWKPAVTMPCTDRSCRLAVRSDDNFC